MPVPSVKIKFNSAFFLIFLAPEIEELNSLRNQFYELRQELQALQANIARLDEYNRDAEARLALMADKNKQLDARKFVNILFLVNSYLHIDIPEKRL